MGLTNRIVCGDSLEVLKTVPDRCVAATVFSPNYDGIRDYDGQTRMDFLELGFQLLRVTRPGGVVAMVVNDQTRLVKSLTTARTIVNWCDRVGWNLWETIIYARHGRAGGWWNTRLRVDHEYIPVFVKGERLAYFSKEHLKVPSKHAGKTYGGTTRLTSGELIPIEPTTVLPTKCRGTIWHYSPSNTEGNRRKMRHPATMPDKLASDLIQAFTRPGDLVLDPMVGSGTTCIQAHRLGRRWLGIDICSDYCALAREGLRDEAGWDGADGDG